MRSLLVSLLGGAFVVATGSCTTGRPSVSPEVAAFAPVRGVLETNCVHCHGDNHLPEMPPITSTRSLANLIGPGKWIIPGHPEQSRFFQVATFPDTTWGAMPPTGHAISKSEVRILRKWILSGAKVPDGDLPLKPRGDLPRSR